MSTFYCVFCGRDIARSEQISKKKRLMSMPGYALECLLLKPGSEVEEPFASLEHRNDEILPEVWSCCRITAIRSLRDNPDGGLVAYADHLAERGDGEDAPAPLAEWRAAHLDEVSFDRLMQDAALPERAVRLAVIKFTALWCPPCRAMDQVFKNIAESGGLPGVDFYEVDSDVEQDLADRFLCPSLPYTLFFKGGKRLDITRFYMGAVNGDIAGAMPEGEFRELCARLLGT